VLRAVKVALDEGLVRPILVGRPAVVNARIKSLGLNMEAGQDFVLIDPYNDPRFSDNVRAYYGLMERAGVSMDDARTQLRGNNTAIASMVLLRGDADAMLCGAVGAYGAHLAHVANIIGLREGVQNLAAMNMLMLPDRTVFICDTYVTPDPSAEQIADMSLLAAEEVRRFGLTPRLALLSHSSFGTGDTVSARKMRNALRLIEARAPAPEVEGEMQGDQHDQQRRAEQPAGRLRHVVAGQHAGQEQAVAEQREEQAGEQQQALDGEHYPPRSEALNEGKKRCRRSTH